MSPSRLLYYLALLFVLTACGGSSDGGGAKFFRISYVEKDIDNHSYVTLRGAGSAPSGGNQNCTPLLLPLSTVCQASIGLLSWENRTTGESGGIQVKQFSGCYFLIFCFAGFTWRVDVPIVPGDNQIVISGVNTNGVPQTERITVANTLYHDPIVEVSSSNVTANSATLNVQVETGDQETEARVKWGTDSELATYFVEELGMIPATPHDAEVSLQLEGLDSDTRYYYQAEIQGEATSSVTYVKSFWTGYYGNPSHPEAHTEAANPVGAVEARLGSIVDTMGADVNAWFEWSTDAEFKVSNSTPGKMVSGNTSPQYHSENLTGLQPLTQYYFRVVVANEHGMDSGLVTPFTTSALTVALAETGAPEDISIDSALLTGRIETFNSSGTGWFEIGTDPALVSSSRMPQSTFSFMDAEIDMRLLSAGLSEHTVYYYRLVASNFAGTHRGAIRSFQTPGPPIVITGAASEITAHSATFNGRINPRGEEATASFQILPAPSSLVPIRFSGSQAVDANESFIPVASSTNEFLPATSYYGHGLMLADNTTYHYRMKGSSGDGVTFGATESFTTGLATPGTCWSKIYDDAHSRLWHGKIDKTAGGKLIVTEGSFAMEIDERGKPAWSKRLGKAVSGDAVETAEGGLVLIGGKNITRLGSDGSVDWQREIVDPYYPTLLSLTRGVDGGYIVAGKYETGGNLDTQGIVIANVSESGDITWQKVFVGTTEAVAVDSTVDQGHIVLAGLQSGDLLLMKLSQNGDVLWSKRYGREYDLQPVALKVADDGGYIVLAQDALLMKLDANGDIVWQGNYAGAQIGEPVAISPTVDGGYVITGTYHVPATPSTERVFAISLVKVDQNGVIDWQYLHHPNDASMRASAVIELDGGGYLVSGSRWVKHLYEPRMWLFTVDEQGVCGSSGTGTSLTFERHDMVASGATSLSFYHGASRSVPATTNSVNAAPFILQFVP